MSRQSKSSRNSDEREFHTAATPSVPVQPDDSLEYERINQIARNDAATSIDVVALQAVGEAQLPSIGAIIARGRSWVADVGVRIAVAKVLQAPIEHTVLYEDGDNVDELVHQLPDIENHLHETVEERRKEVSYLHGDPDPSGARWIGAVPTPASPGKPGVSPAGARSARWFIDVGFGIVAIPAEFALIVVNLMLLTGNNVISSIGGAIAGSLMAILVPKAVGHTLASAVRGGHVSWAKAATLFGLAGMWIAGSAALASARVDAIIEQQKQNIAATDGIAVTQVHLVGVDSTAQFWTWLIFILALGIAMIAVTITWSNPHITQVMRLDKYLLELERQQADLTGRIGGMTSRAKTAVKAGELVLEAHREYAKSIPAFVTSLTALYNAELLRSLNDPDALPLLSKESGNDTGAASTRLFVVPDVDDKSEEAL